MTQSLSSLFGYEWQNGVRPGPRKLAQFHKALLAQGTPALRAQDGKGMHATVYVKLFDPCSGWTYFVTEFDAAENEIYGICIADCAEYGYSFLGEIASTRGKHGIGIELDMGFVPQPLHEALAEYKDRLSGYLLRKLDEVAPALAGA